MNSIEKVAILSLSFLSLIATAAMAPALTGIHEHFFGASDTLVKLVVTLPALICIPIGILNNTFLKFISKKNLIIIGILIYTIGGISSTFSTSIYMLLFTKGILGVGLGITAPLSLVLIGDFFHGSKRATFMGLSTATTNLGGILSTLVVGFLALKNWRYSFLVYIVGLVVLVLVALFLPKPPNELNDLEKINTGHIEEDIVLNKGIFKYAILILLALIGFYAVPTNMDFLIKFRNFGTPQTAANLVSISTLASLISAIFFQKIVRVFKSYYAIVIFIVMALGFFFLAYSPNLGIATLGSIFAGLAFGNVIPFTMLFASNLVHKTHTALSILIITTALYLGEFLSPLVLQLLANILNINNVIGSLIGATIIASIAIIVSIFTSICDRNLKL